jgi:hypothetical protein
LSLPTKTEKEVNHETDAVSKQTNQRKSSDGGSFFHNFGSEAIDTLRENQA